MVNTFLPWPDSQKTARLLDNKRLGKQRVEALQILKVNLGLTQGWKNHPAAVMWRGNEGMLVVYIYDMCDEWTRRGYADTVRATTYELVQEHGITIGGQPWWWGNKEFHQSHRSNLVRKDPIHYRFRVNPNLPYKWPTPEGTLRVTEKKGK